ncbi:MAG TPA: DNA-directed RNA polymerase subunit alpha C-terminal domain-containing protein [bacterium]|nr:DNA-directed RNA polymerase subunit alpha C-terminal domain-containing protein [bacterium]
MGLCSVDGPSGPAGGRILGPAEAAMGAWKLRAYQEGMVEGLRNDVRAQASPWLGLSSPMQTGKSRLTGPIVHMLRQEMGDDLRVLILTSGRVITGQMMEDLAEGLPPGEVGRYDGLVKTPKSVTVTGTLALVRNLDLFPAGPKTVVILDEAYATQSPSVGRILEHFGLARRASKEEGGLLVPVAGNGLVIGFSGTGAGLDGYKISGSLSLLEAMEAGWIRHMRGERQRVHIESQKMTSKGGERMVWWKATPANAEFLAELFDQKIHSASRRSLVFVPTIRHGRLLKKALEARHGQGFVRFVHSGTDMDGYRVNAELQLWKERGGALISVRMISRGFRATGADAVFHTYQTDSLELFGQRTGRAWGVLEGMTLADLSVLELAWGLQGSFANLPRLAGLVDYPKSVFETRSLKGSFRGLETKSRQRRERAQCIRAGRVSPLFARVPLSQEWQRLFAGILEREGGLSGVAKKTGIHPKTVAAFELGVIPTHLIQMERLQRFLGGKEAAVELWLRLWKTAVEEIRTQQEEVDETVGPSLLEWSGDVERLEEILAGRFTKGVGPEPLTERLFQGARDLAPTTVSDEELRAVIVSHLAQPPLEGRRLEIFQRAFMSGEPISLQTLAEEYAVERSRIGQIIKGITDRLEVAIYSDLIRRMPRPPEGEPLTLAYDLFFVLVAKLPFEGRAKNYLKNSNIKYLGELLGKSASMLLKTKNFGRKSLMEIEEVLADMGLSLGMPVSIEPVHKVP